uniref:Ovule protein n=1 Tax=Ascaris lumbricoides TaxID=6252 RepID=A0A0M3HXE8_ASCLU
MIKYYSEIPPPLGSIPHVCAIIYYSPIFHFDVYFKALTRFLSQPLIQCISQFFSSILLSLPSLILLHRVPIYSFSLHLCLWLARRLSLAWIDVK